MFCLLCVISFVYFAKKICFALHFLTKRTVYINIYNIIFTLLLLQQSATI